MNPPKTTWIDTPIYLDDGSGIQVSAGIDWTGELVAQVTVTVVGERGRRNSRTVVLRDTERAALITALGGTP